MKTHEQIFRAAPATRSGSRPGIRHRLFYLSLLLLGFGTNCGVEMPAVQQLISNSTQLSVSVERFAYVAEQLPKQLSTEREEIGKALQTQEKDIAALLGQGTQFSVSLNTTFTTFDTLMKRFGVGEPKPAYCRGEKIKDSSR